MELSEIPLFAMLRGRLGYLSERQRLIAENVANSDTPGFAPRDLKPFAVHAQAQMAPAGGGQAGAAQAATQPSHMQPPKAAGGSYHSMVARDSETTLDGNSVVLEEEMMKMSDARMNYDAAIGFYQKSLNLLRMAARAPGR